MIYQLIGGIANVIGNFLFVYYWNFGISGSAMATVVSQTLAAGLVIYHLYNMDARYCLRFKKITLDMPLAREIFRIGIPAAIPHWHTGSHSNYCNYAFEHCCANQY